VPSHARSLYICPGSDAPRGGVSGPVGDHCLALIEPAGPSNQPEARLPPPARGEALVLRRIQPAPTPPPGRPMPAFDERRAICRLHRALQSGLSTPGKMPAAARQGKRQRVHSRLQSRGRVVRRTPALALSLPVPVQPGHLPRPGWSRLRGNAERRCRSVPRWYPRSKQRRSPAHRQSHRPR
jgi:hypothetical protein